jgi:hypothetical protein
MVEIFWLAQTTFSLTCHLFFTYFCTLVLIGRAGLISNFGGGHIYLLASLCFENKVIKCEMMEVANGSQVTMLVQ